MSGVVADWEGQRVMAGSIGEPYGGKSRKEYERLLKAKLDPRAIRLTIAMSGLLQMVHEMIKRSVIDQVHEFFWNGIADGETQYDESRYAKDVLNRAQDLKGNQRKFRGSAEWLVWMGAISPTQLNRLDQIYSYRHELTHELAEFIIDVDRNVDVELVADALKIFRDIERFWIDIEISVGSFDDADDVSVDDVATGSLLILQACLDAIVEEWDQKAE